MLKREWTERQINEAIGVVILFMLLAFSYALGHAQGSAETYSQLMLSGQCKSI